MVTKISQHAAELGKSICEDYGTLSNILMRHEALIRKRWLKKTTAQRREVLLEAWPNMPEEHRPDCLERIGDLGEAFSNADKLKLPSAACMWPYINVEDLSQPKSLLIFLNARGRNPPSAFAMSKAEFSPLAEMSPCDPEPELTQFMLHLSVDPDPTQYGSPIQVDKDISEYDNADGSWTYCMRPTLQVLYMKKGS